MIVEHVKIFPGRAHAYALMLAACFERDYERTLPPRALLHRLARDARVLLQVSRAAEKWFCHAFDAPAPLLHYVSRVNVVHRLHDAKETVMDLDPATFLPHLAALSVDHLLVVNERISLIATAVRPWAPCPLCGQPSSSVHSTYTRRLADRPWGETSVVLQVRARRFRCRCSSCPRRIFCERLAPLTHAYGRRTTPQRRFLERLGLALAGRAGARFAATAGTPVSRMTLLRLVRALPRPPFPPPRVVGVDDWCIRRGRTYGTIVCDPERHRPLDLLPDRTATTWASWVAEHAADVRVISRDRAQAYAEGARRGAPQAVQVADRWHLLHNAAAALEGVLVQERAALPFYAARPPVTPAPADIPSSPLRAGRPHDPLQAVRRAQRQERVDTVRRLHQEGVGLRAIAARLHLSRNTVRTYVRAERAEVCSVRPRRRSRLDRYAPFLLQQWADGERNGAVLLEALRARGYRGGYTILKTYLARVRAVEGETLRPAHRGDERLTPRALVWIILQRPVDWTGEDEASLAQACAASPAIAAATALLRRFAVMVREQGGGVLRAWVEEMQGCGIPVLQRFAEGIRSDEEAVRAGLTLPWSQGQIEGQVNRLKMLKRQMFGRAKLDLLRQRVLLA